MTRVKNIVHVHVICKIVVSIGWCKDSSLRKAWAAILSGMSPLSLCAKRKSKGPCLPIKCTVKTKIRLVAKLETLDLSCNCSLPFTCR